MSDKHPYAGCSLIAGGGGQRRASVVRNIARIDGSTTIAMAWPTSKLDEFGERADDERRHHAGTALADEHEREARTRWPGSAGGTVVQLREQDRGAEAADQEPDDRHRHARYQHREHRTDAHDDRGDPDQSNRTDAHLDPVAAEPPDRHPPGEREEGETRHARGCSQIVAEPERRPVAVRDLDRHGSRTADGEEHGCDVHASEMRPSLDARRPPRRVPGPRRDAGGRVPRTAGNR